jgi:hypothetical protein
MPTLEKLRAAIVGALVTAAVFSAIFIAAARAEDNGPQSTHRIRSAVIGGAGNTVIGASHRMSATLGQPSPVGLCASESHSAGLGFWWGIARELPTAVNDEPPPHRNVLFQNYPNPFNPTTTIRFGSAVAGPVQLAVYNVRGQKVRQLVDEVKGPGLHAVTWDGTNDKGSRVASGVYFYRLVADRYVATRKMVLLK